MREAYKDVMDRIEVTPEMQTRILKAIRDADIQGRSKRAVPMGRLAIAACLALLVAGAVALPKLPTKPPEKDPSGVQNGIWSVTQVSSLQELSQLVGFEMEELKTLPFAVTETQYRAYPGGMAEVTYLGETQSVTLRKLVGDADPSGDYSSYSDTLMLTRNGYCVTLSGEGGLYSLAVWQDGTYSYSIRASQACSEETWESILEGTG